MLWLSFPVLIFLGTRCHAQTTDAMLFLVRYNADAQEVYYNYTEADWAYMTNITDYNMDQSIRESEKAAAFDKEMGVEANTFDWQSFTNEDVKRQFSKIVDIGSASLPEADYTRMSELTSTMVRIYSTAKVCKRPGDTSGTCYPLDPDLTEIMATSTNWDELVWAWQGWRNESGRRMPNMYEEFAGLLNEAAVINGYEDNGAYWRSWYEDASFRQDCENLWNEVRPLYEQVHAYVRRKLQERYPTGTFPSSGHIPAHILGNMWAQDWMGIESLVRPYPEVPGVDVTDEMVNQGYTALTIFELADDFFASLNMLAMPQEFWDKSMLEKPSDGREVVCHASAWDFYNRVDFRIKQCTEVNMDHLLTAHHEMGHVEYFLQYEGQPVQFRDGANPGFHEAIGDTVALSVVTPEHLTQIGLLTDFVDDERGDINFLMQQALTKLAFIPFGYLIDQWRWDLFADVFQRVDYNKRWWDVRCKYQGVSPPVVRTSADFDAGAKYHVPNNTPYIRYFVSHILQFQFHQALCVEAGNTNPLHRCDIYGSNPAGKLLENMMQLGSSLPWHDALEQICGVREMSAAPLMEYFKPLMDWLAIENAGHPVGWLDACPNGMVEP